MQLLQDFKDKGEERIRREEERKERESHRERREQERADDAKEFRQMMVMAMGGMASAFNQGRKRHRKNSDSDDSAIS